MAAAGFNGNGNLAHFGAAVLAGYWFQYDQALTPKAAEALTSQAEMMMSRFPELFASPRSSGAECDPIELLEHLAAKLGGVWAIGHDVIFTALALRSLERVSEVGQRWVIDGLGSVITWCQERPFTEVQVGDLGHVTASLEVGDASPAELGDVATLWDQGAAARLALETMAGFECVYLGLHQGHIGHVMDHAHALVSLDRLGYHEAAEAGYEGFLTHVARLRRAWHTRFEYPEVNVAVSEDPRHVSYWRRGRARSDWAFGHVFKYPYAFYDLAPLVDDPSLTNRARAIMGRLI